MKDGIQNVQPSTSGAGDPFILMAFANLVIVIISFSVSIFQKTVMEYSFFYRGLPALMPPLL
jgi:hypothetical protein